MKLDPLGTAKAFIREQQARLGLLDPRRDKLGLDRIFRDDIFVVSYPRSGNTWVRFLLAHLRYPGRMISFKELDALLPDIHKKDSPNPAGQCDRPRILKSHYGHFSCYPRMIYVYRDGRDVLLSFYHYVTQRTGFSGSLAEFLDSSHVRMFGTWLWEDHVRGALSHAAANPDNTLLLQYEKLLTEPETEARRLAEFCGFACGDTEIREAVERASLDSLKTLEKTHGHNESQKEMTFVRSGLAGKWRDVFSHEMANRYWQRAGSELERLGYAQ